VRFEVCQASKREVYNPDDKLKALGFGMGGTVPVYTSRDCPIEDGWMFATRRMEDGEENNARFLRPWRHDREVFYFIRIPISQFSRIGPHPVSGLWNTGTVGTATAVNDGQITMGWTVSISNNDTMDGYVYCRYNEGAFNYGPTP